MAIIYVPKGRAREYSPLAANLYDGCSHGCLYCYAPGIRFQSAEDFHTSCKPRKDIIAKLSADMPAFRGSREQVLLSFIGDPYCPEEMNYRTTLQALEMFYAERIPVAILTKGGSRVARDITIFKKFGRSIKVGASLTFASPGLSKKWEPGAASPQDRLATLAGLQAEGIRTWASFEPVLYVDESLHIMEASIDYVDEYRLGKLNNYKGLDKNVDWTSYLTNAVDLLRVNGKPFYVKQDLREAAPEVRLYGSEILMDDHQAEPFAKEKGEMFAGAER
jgi:DNA repair photolyase